MYALFVPIHPPFVHEVFHEWARKGLLQVILGEGAYGRGRKAVPVTEQNVSLQLFNQHEQVCKYTEARIRHFVRTWLSMRNSL